MATAEPSQETADAPSRRREAFPRPASIGQWTWTLFTLMYATTVVLCAVYEATWLIGFDPDNGAPIAFVTALVTAPLGWVGGGLAAAVSRGLGLSDDADTVVVWSSMAAFGLMQAWFVWRLGMDVGARRARSRA